MHDTLSTEPLRRYLSETFGNHRSYNPSRSITKNEESKTERQITTNTRLKDILLETRGFTVENHHPPCCVDCCDPHGCHQQICVHFVHSFSASHSLTWNLKSKYSA